MSKPSILITGANGFIGKNLAIYLKHCYKVDLDIIEVSRETDDSQLKEHIARSNIIISLAGENRPKTEMGFIEGNVDYTKKICAFSTSYKLPIIYISSTQAEQDNIYGRSKLSAENAIKQYSKNAGALIRIVRLPNVFGKWCKPNYNSFIATMCYNIWHDIPISIDDPGKILYLVYVDDVIRVLADNVLSILAQKNTHESEVYFTVAPQYHESLGDIYRKLLAIKNGQYDSQITERAVGFDRALAATFMSYCPENKIKYALKEHQDSRGSFYEVFKLKDYGQVSISTTLPGVTRGNHFHYSKQEKFLVLQGECLFKFRSLSDGQLITCATSDKTKEVVEVPLGYTHNFTNIGKEELIVLIWCNEEFDKENPDTYFLEV